MVSTFERARRRTAFRRLARLVRQRDAATLLPLDEAERRLRPFRRRYVGLRSVPLRQIVGTDSRVRDFDRDFLPRRPGLATRWRQVEQAFPEGDFPPVVLYRLGDAYFVLDGHHRVAIARQRGMETIDAEVTELEARWHLPADADIPELIHAEQERIFMEESGLEGSRPEARIRFTRPGGYVELLENVKIHGYELMLRAERALPPAEIAGDWYDRVYVPAVEGLRREGVFDAYPRATEADVFLAAYQRRRELFPDVGCPPLEETARRVHLHGDRRPPRRVRRFLARARAA